MIEIAKSMMGLFWAGTIFGGREMLHMLMHQDPQAAMDDASFVMRQMSEAMGSRVGPSPQPRFQGHLDQAGTGWGPVVHEE